MEKPGPDKGGMVASTAAEELTESLNQRDRGLLYFYNFRFLHVNLRRICRSPTALMVRRLLCYLTQTAWCIALHFPAGRLCLNDVICQPFNKATDENWKGPQKAHTVPLPRPHRL